MTRLNAAIGVFCVVILGWSVLNVAAAEPNPASGTRIQTAASDQEKLDALFAVCVRNEEPECLALVTPDTSASPTSTPTSTPTASPSPTPTATPAATATPTPSASPTATATPSPTPTITPPSSTPTPTPSPTPPPTPAPSGTDFILIARSDLMALPTSGAAWTAVLSRSNQSASSPSVSDQDDPDNVTVLAKALVAARTGDATKRSQVVSALVAVQSSSVDRALALGRELGAYVLAADLIGYRDPAFVSWVSRMRTVATSGGPSSLVNCSEVRLNNWGTWCLASRIAAERYLGLDLARSVSVFRGYLGDRSQYAGFVPGDTSWQCNPSAPVGINPPCVRSGFDIGGVLPDDQRRGGGFTTNPGCENYVDEALQGVTLSGALLRDYPAWTWSDSAIRRAFDWLADNGCTASGDDAGNPWVVNHFAGTSFPTSPAGAGKGWIGQDWMYQ